MIGSKVDELKSSEKQVAVLVAQNATPSQRIALKSWVNGLLEIRNSNETRLEKSKMAIRLTYSNEILWPMVKGLAHSLKTQIWDKSSSSVRLGAKISAVSMLIFGGKAAGVAALGGAIAVPLWIVFCAGGMFAKSLYDEISKSDGDK